MKDRTQNSPIIFTSRLKLRRWKQEDKEPFAHLNAEPKVMEFMPKLLSREESDDFVKRIELEFEKEGFGLFAVELTDLETFIGCIGLHIPSFTASFTPCVEIGWRIAYQYWGKGYAPEAGKAVLNWGFTQLKLPEIFSFTTVANMRSRRVMEKIGMSFVDEFEHPNLPETHALRNHVLYKIVRPFRDEALL